MATRTISTRMAIQGESEYKAAVTRINAELRTLRITPACAGKSFPIVVIDELSRDHPPRARGKGDGKAVDLPRRGITPACAGKRP